MLTSNSNWLEDFLPAGDEFSGDNSDGFAIEMDQLLAILEESSDPLPESSQISSEDLSYKNVFQGESDSVIVKHEQAPHPQNGIQESEGDLPTVCEISGSFRFHSSSCSAPSDAKTGMESELLFESPGNSCIEFDNRNLETPLQIGSPVQSCSLSLADWLQLPFSECDTYSGERVGSSVNASVHSSINNKEIANQPPYCSTRFNFFAGTSHLMSVDNSYLNLSKFSSICGSSTEDFGELERNLCTSPVEVSFMDDIFLPNDLLTEFNSSQDSDKISEASYHCSPTPICTDSGTDVDNIAALADTPRQCIPDSRNLTFILSNGENKGHVKNEAEDLRLPTHNIWRSTEVNLETQEGTTNFSVSTIPLMDLADANNCQGKCEATYSSLIVGNPSSNANDGALLNNSSRHSLPHIQSFILSKKEEVPSSKNQTVCIKEERNDKALSSAVSNCHSPKLTGEAINNNPSSHRMHVDADDADDADICILEDISAPVCPHPSTVHGKPLVASQHSTYNDSLHSSGTRSMRLKANDERLTLQIALQDLARPKSEASPPDGVLAVPLLKHQRIALSWMAQKETTSLYCCGGILADDQGLGKTISTIALILKERSPASKMSSVPIKQGDSKALNLDEDDDGSPQLDGMKQDEEPGCGTSNRTVKSENSYVPVNGRPSAGTLVVCPTSVLRQWADELHDKVTSKANLSILVYHGTNRTKDPYELAKYDVVLTTYSIVSMEVPKQPVMDKDDDDKGKDEPHGMPHMGLSSRKRKYPPSSNKKSLKHKKGADGELLESVSRPLARVGWFRVILDEAQSIKNHRTQVARACWGLRAKRRWCLSGTPIQNAVDDLYSYFRFLRYDPYAAYKSFCSMIKVPVTKHPTTGYKKLQTVLKTIMLRRTKGSLIDGEPIINLPPKSIELKKVDFSKEEREFYSRLEADSRAQFKVYAAAGTVKQNYVNILFMLLRLRQACDHPLLVRGFDSNSIWRSSREVANKLPRDKQMVLLNCLEACLAICGICNDPPEDAVVTICGHSFCSQCICEHLTGDDKVCPAANCKVQLSVTSVFSRATLKSSLSDQQCQECSPANSSSELFKKLEPYAEGLSSDSSKIKAALEVLQSLSKPRNCTTINNLLKSSDVASYPENSHDSNTKIGEKAIVFSQWTRMLDLLEARLKSSSIQYRRLDGTMSVAARDKAVKDFNSLPEVSVMIMSLKAASLGLNMVAACHVLLLDLWWNPTTEDQAIDRAHRIGQTRPVTVLRLTVKDTVEDRILALQQKKREMVASAFGEDKTGSCQTRLTVDDLKYLFMLIIIVARPGKNVDSGVTHNHFQWKVSPNLQFPVFIYREGVSEFAIFYYAFIQ
ncbi:hypothetical protein NE237_001503 [Protea cynaroides]|uniref:Helicase-like transcription factor CHR28 n=1 Tax=Protea cynaroides TaxID=273540 RepID=A0A9Q0KTG3_9MAGN|nr:hypothetical protein NE237_001503 [Protea cynaroides]